jgi:hypothetical protein
MIQVIALSILCILGLSLIIEFFLQYSDERRWRKLNKRFQPYYQWSFNTPQRERISDARSTALGFGARRFKPKTHTCGESS